MANNPDHTPADLANQATTPDLLAQQYQLGSQSYQPTTIADASAQPNQFQYAWDQSQMGLGSSAVNYASSAAAEQQAAFYGYGSNAANAFGQFSGGTSGIGSGSYGGTAASQLQATLAAAGANQGLYSQYAAAMSSFGGLGSQSGMSQAGLGLSGSGLASGYSWMHKGAGTGHAELGSDRPASKYYCKNQNL